MSLQLRDYQRELVDNIKKSMIAGNKSIIVQSPPRSGKTVVMAYIAKQATAKGNHVLFFSHRKEINEQVEATFSKLGVDMDLVTIGGVQSLIRRLDKLPVPEIILIDEAHHSKAKSYVKIINYFLQAYKLLFTGTPVRLNGEGFDDIADDLIVGKSVKWLQEHNRIAIFRYYAPSMIDTSLLKKSSGDFTKASVDEAMRSVIYGDVLKHYERLAKDKQAIVYTHNVEASKNVSEAFNNAGYSSIAVSGKTPRNEREDAMRRFKNGELKIMVNCELFTEGIDLPNVDVCIMLRPTQSLSLYLQFAMRPLNPREGKVATIIDHVGNVERFGLPNMDRDWTLEGTSTKKQATKVGEPATRVCEVCYATYWSAERVCPECGHVNELTAKEIEEIKEAELVEITEKRLAKIRDKVSTYADPGECQSMEELKEYRKQHGYKAGWVWYMAKKIGILY